MADDTHAKSCKRSRQDDDQDLQRKGKKLKNEIGKCNERFSGGTQQDSQEFLLSLLEQLHAATKVPCSEDPCSSSTEIDACISGNVEAERKWTEYLNKHGKSVVVELFEGQFQSSMKCKGCGEFTYKFDPFMFLPTPIPSTEHERPPLTLRDCLGVMFKEETFDGKAWSCSKCHQKTDMTRKLSISRMPQIVMIYLKRFQNDNLAIGLGLVVNLSKSKAITDIYQRLKLTLAVMLERARFQHSEDKGLIQQVWDEQDAFVELHDPDCVSDSVVMGNHIGALFT
eukprot:Em0008g414a